MERDTMLIAVLSGVLVLATSPCGASPASLPALVAKPATLPAYVEPTARAVILRWLSAHPGFHVIDDRDCGCDDDLTTQRRGSGGVWQANTNYHPYYVVGDFNGKDSNDLAIGVRRSSTGARFQVLIINNYRSKRADPTHVYLSKPFGDGEALFYGPPRPKPYRLLIGGFGSEGQLFIPQRSGGYVLK